MIKIFFVSHCILNLGSIVKQGGTQSDLKKRFIRLALDKDVQLVQLKCPEFSVYGHLRWGHTKEQFSTPFFIRECQKIAREIADQTAEYQRFPDQFEILGFVGIQGSPTCGITLTCQGFSGGELFQDTIIPPARKLSASGVLVDELRKVVDFPFYTLQDAIECIEKL